MVRKKLLIFLLLALSLSANAQNKQRFFYFLNQQAGDTPGTLTDGGGNTFGATIPTPTFSNYTPTDFNGHGLLTEQTHHALGRGYRTPD